MRARIEAAIDAAPYADEVTGFSPVETNGPELRPLSRRPDETYELDDLDIVTFNEGIRPAPHAVVVPRQKFPKLVGAYGTYVASRLGLLPQEDINAAVEHELQHADAYEALGVDPHNILLGMYFTKKRDIYGRDALPGASLFAIAEVKTVKLGAAALMLAPAQPNEVDFSIVANMGYVPEEAARVIVEHNAAGRAPYLPEPHWNMA